MMARKKKELFKNRFCRSRGRKGGRKSNNANASHQDVESPSCESNARNHSNVMEHENQPGPSSSTPPGIHLSDPLHRPSSDAALTIDRQPGHSAPRPSCSAGSPYDVTTPLPQPGPSGPQPRCSYGVSDDAMIPRRQSGPSAPQPSCSSWASDDVVTPRRQSGPSAPQPSCSFGASDEVVTPRRQRDPSALQPSCSAPSHDIDSDENEDSLNLHFPQDEVEGDEDGRPSAARRKFNLMTLPEHEDDDEGYLLVHRLFLTNLVSALVCPQCFSDTLEIQAGYKGGLSSKIDVFCTSCEENIFSNFTSPGGKRKDITKRVVLAAKDSGLGYEGLCNFFSILNVPKPMHHKTFQSVSASVHDSAVAAANTCMQRAAEQIAATTTVINPGQLQYPATTVSFDGTWHKRGHSSHHGVGVAIDCTTGLVLDTQVLSNYCHGCEVGPKAEDDNYINWRASHHCQKNFDGSANAMEAETALAIFRRSVDTRGLVYCRMLCDGDAKSHQKINDNNVYDFNVEKEDCINHISKRMFNALESTKNSNKKELNRKLTKTNIEKITNTYATNLKRSAPDTIQMKEDVYGGIYHMISTDNGPRHNLCPAGVNSWCFYQRAIALNEVPRKHNPTIKADVVPFVMPIVDRLTQPELLKRCAAMQTQNANESFNSLIWARCSKTEFASRRSIETAVALSVLHFNCGPSGIFPVLQSLGITIGLHSAAHSAKKLDQKLQQSDKRGKRLSKWARKQRKRKRLQLEDRRERDEGDTYGAGQFNL